MISADKLENAFIFCHNGEVTNNETVERVIKKYCEQQLEWGVKNNWPTLDNLGPHYKAVHP